MLAKFHQVWYPVLLQFTLVSIYACTKLNHNTAYLLRHVCVTANLLASLILFLCASHTPPSSSLVT